MAGTTDDSKFATPAAFRVGAVSYNTLAEAVAAANDGATISVNRGVYRRQTAVIARNNLRIVGDGGMAHFDAQGENAQNKGTLVIRGANVTIENLEFSSAWVSDGNGAAIRQEARRNHRRRTGAKRRVLRRFLRRRGDRILVTLA